MKNDIQKLESLILEVSKVLTNGGTIVYPTETVYGLGANAGNQEAVNKIFRIKGRQRNKPLIVLAKDLEMVRRLVDLGSYEQLLKKYWPGPLTGVFRAVGPLSNGIVSKEGTVAVRISPYPLVQKLFKFIDFPLVSTSANKSGDRNCTTVDEVKVSLGNQFDLVDLVADLGVLPPSEPSTVIDFTTKTPKVLRSGAIEFSFFNHV